MIFSSSSDTFPEGEKNIQQTSKEFSKVEILGFVQSHGKKKKL